MQYKLAFSLTLIFFVLGRLCFAQKSQDGKSSAYFFSADSLTGTWGNCAREFDKKTKYKNVETNETVAIMGNICPEISFNKDSTGSVKTMGTNQPPYIKFLWHVKGGTLYISNLVKSQNYKSDYLSNGQYAISKKHTAAKGIRTQIILTDKSKLRYILTR